MIEKARPARSLALGAILGSLVFFSTGCQKISKMLVKPPAEGVTHRSYSVLFSGYEQTVTVHAAPEELLAFLSDPHNWLNISGTEAARPMTKAQTLEEQMQPGNTFPLNVKKMGIEISGRMILVKATPKELWFIWDNPQMMQVQRWRFEPAKEETRLTINLMTEAPKSVLTKVVEETGITGVVCREIDYMLASIQAHFNPSLNPEELVAKGLRGEFYETLWQVHEVGIWIAPTPEDMIRKLLGSDTLIAVSTAIQVEGIGECLYEPENRRRWDNPEDGEPVYCPASVKLAGFEWKVDSFISLNPQAAQHLLTAYGVVANIVFRLELAGQPDKGGTRVRLIFAVEPPGATTSKLMEVFISISSLPQWMEKALIELKEKAERVE